jgi:hypothetical protein
VKDLTVYDLEKKKGETYNHKTPVNTGWSVSGTADLGVCGSRDKQLTLVNLKTMKIQKQQFFDEAVKSTAVSNSGALVACGGKIKKLFVYVLPTTNEDAVPENCPPFEKKVESDSSIETLSFSECEKMLAVGDGKNQVNVYNVEAVAAKEADEDVTLLHRFVLKEGLLSLRFNDDSCTLGCVGKNNCVRVWDIGDTCDPYPYECSLEWYLKHYVKKKPHLIYRQEYGDRGKKNMETGELHGNTIIHRLVEEGTVKMLKCYVDGVENLLPVENDSGLTPLDIAVQQNDFVKSQFLIEKYTKNMTPMLAGLPMFSRLLGAISEETTTSDPDLYHSTLVYKFPDLCVELLNRSTINLQDHTLLDGAKRMSLNTHTILAKPCEDFLPFGPLWSKKDEQQGGKDVEVESFAAGYKDFITSKGSFRALVRSGNVDIIKTEAMQVAIHYKWKTYGWRMHTIATAITLAMGLAFLGALVFQDGTSTTGRKTHFSMMSGSTFLSLFLAKREFEESKGSSFRRYFKNARNLVDLSVIGCIWMLTALSLHVLVTHDDGEVTSEGISLVQKPGSAICVLLLLAEALACLGSYTFFGENTRLIYAVTVDSASFLSVMFLFMGAYGVVLRVLLHSSDPDAGGGGSPFESQSSHWTQWADMFSILFSFLFLGDFESSDLESTSPNRREKTVLNLYSKLFFYGYGLIYLIVLLNLLIAIMGDSYDRVKDDEAANSSLARARALAEIDRVWGGGVMKIPVIQWEHKTLPPVKGNQTQRENQNQSDDSESVEVEKQSGSMLPGFPIKLVRLKKHDCYPKVLHFLASKGDKQKAKRLVGSQAPGLSNRLKMAQEEGFADMAKEIRQLVQQNERNEKLLKQLLSDKFKNLDGDMKELS